MTIGQRPGAAKPLAGDGHAHGDWRLAARSRGSPVDRVLADLGAKFGKARCGSPASSVSERALALVTGFGILMTGQIILIASVRYAGTTARSRPSAYATTSFRASLGTGNGKEALRRSDSKRVQTSRAAFKRCANPTIARQTQINKSVQC